MRLNHDQLPTLTRHARERAAEMDVPLENVLCIYRHPSVTRTAAPRPDQRGTGPRFIVKSDSHPGYALCVALDTDTGQAFITSVLFDTGPAAYVRNGKTAATTP